MGHCGTQACRCVIKFLFDPPCIDVCPCTTQDILDFQGRVEKGFTQIIENNSCNACFSPIALQDCESVEWHLNSTDSPPIGTSAARETFCYAFPDAGDYNVIMNVSKKKDDGSNCDKQKRTQAITITCLSLPGCVNSVIDNPDFNLGAVAGGLNSGGMSRGWKAIAGEPEVIAGEPGSMDGWTIQLSGNLDTAGILSRMDPICLEPGPASFTTTVKGSKSNSDNRRFPGILKVFLGRGLSFPQVGFKLNECDGVNCYELASVVLPVLDTG